MKKTFKPFTKFFAVMFAVIFAFSAFSMLSFAAEKDNHLYIKLTADKTSIKPGDSFTVTVSAKTDYPVINVNTMIVYDANYYELDTSNGAAVKKVTKMPVSLNQTTNSPLAMYHQSYSREMARQYKLVFAGITWLPSLSSQGKSTPTTTLNEFEKLYTIKFKMKKNAPKDGVGFLGVDPAYIKTGNDSMRSGIYAAHGGATLGDEVIASYGQTIDLSQAVLFGKEVVKAPADHKIEIDYKSKYATKDLFSDLKGYSFLSADNSIVNISVDTEGETLEGLKTGKTYIAGISKDGKTRYNAEVTVKYTWWQWIIVIFLFGWLWY